MMYINRNEEDDDNKITNNFNMFNVHIVKFKR